MKKFPTVTIATLTLGAALLATTTPRPAFARVAAKGGQNVTVTVDGSGYHPATLKLKAGKPVRVTFVSKASTCANEVSIPALKKTFSLKPGQEK